MHGNEGESDGGMNDRIKLSRLVFLSTTPGVAPPRTYFLIRFACGDPSDGGDVAGGRVHNGGGGESGLHGSEAVVIFWKPALTVVAMRWRRHLLAGAVEAVGDAGRQQSFLSSMWYDKWQVWL